MALYQQWMDIAQAAADTGRQKSFWTSYYEEEKNVYRKILSEKQFELSGTVQSLAEQMGMDTVLFAGFLDGINTSLKTPLDVQALKADTPIALSIDPEKLYYNMHEAKAHWLYTLKEWDDILTPERQKALTKAYRQSKVYISTQKVGPNDPCPCGSGKKYKHCCL